VKGDYRHTTSVTELLSGLGWEPLSLRRRNTRLVMLYKRYMASLLCRWMVSVTLSEHQIFWEYGIHQAA